jgi:hypothetical protein
MRQSRNGENSAVVSEIEQNARKLASFMYDIWDDTRDGADYPQLRNRSGMSELICAPAFKYAVDKGWFVQGPGHDQDQKWHLNFSGSSGSSSPTELPPVQPVEGSELIKQAMEGVDEATKAKAKPSRPQ